MTPRPVRRAFTIALAAAATASSAGLAVAAPYTAHIPAENVRLQPSGGALTVWQNQVIVEGTIASGTSGIGRIALPAGTAFTTFTAQLTAYAHGSADPSELLAVVSAIPTTGPATQLLRTPLAAIGPGTTASTPAGVRVTSVDVELGALGDTTCAPTCAVVVTGIDATIDDAVAPSMTFSPVGVPPVTDRRTIDIGYALTDTGAGPAYVDLLIDGIAQPARVWSGGPIDPGLLSGQATGGAPSVSGQSTITLPDRDGTYTLALRGSDVAGNSNTSAPVTVTLDRAAPTLAATLPANWCTSSCVATLEATDASGVRTVEALLNGKPIQIPSPTGAPASYRATIDLGPLAIPGIASLVVRATDVLGRTSERQAILLLDPDPPTIEQAVADPATREVEVTARDLSGIRSASATVDGKTYRLAPAGDGLGERHVLTAELPTRGLPALLDDLPVTITATDQAGNTTTRSAQFTSRGVAPLTATVSKRRLTAGRRVTVTGRLAAEAELAGSEIELRLVNPAWQGPDAAWIATASPDGAFSATIEPNHSGTLIASYRGSAKLRPATFVVAKLAVAPIIRVRFTGTRMPGGLIRDLRVTGRFIPSEGSGIKLLWQARPAGSTRWVSFCPDRAAIPVSGGKISGRCEIAGLDPRNQYRLVYRPTGPAVFAAGASAPQPARDG